MNGHLSKSSGYYGSSRDLFSSRGDREDRHRDRPSTHRDGRDRGDRDRDRDRDRYADRDRDRRRSRSPHSRSGPSRRDADPYASSRDHRDRDRENRHGGRDRDYRRDDRDRDRGDRDRRPMGGRRDDDRFGGPRRDGRDAMPDRSSRNDERADRDEWGAQQRGRGKQDSPPPKKREPTPDLTDVVPITERKRRLTQWDIKPPGYENVTAEQAKLSGMFPLPGAPRQQAMDPSRLQAFMNQPAGTASGASLRPSNSRQSKRLFVYNIPPNTTDDTLAQFFNLHLNGLNVIEGNDPVLNAGISPDRSFALLEFRHPTDATVALTLDGISMDDSSEANGSGSAKAGLELRRPKDYIVPSITEENADQPAGPVSTNVPDTQNKISITNIPPYLTEEQVSELLVAFGELRAFVLARDRSTGESRGFAFCEYVAPETTNIAVEGLNGMELSDRALKVKRASIGVTQAPGLEMSVGAMSMFAGTKASTEEEGGESRVLQLLNMVKEEELMDVDEYEEICDDVREECEKYGQVLELKVPRPSGGSKLNNGVGKIFVKFGDEPSATKAMKAMAGRKFADRTVVTTYFSEENFDVNAW